MKQDNKISAADLYAASLELEIKKAELKFEILKNAGSCISKKKDVLHDFILQNEKRYSIRLMTEVLGASRYWYHKWKKNPLNETKRRKILMHQEITRLFFAFERRYGSERIAVELRHAGHKISSKTVRNYMRELGLSARGKKELTGVRIRS